MHQGLGVGEAATLLNKLQRALPPDPMDGLVESWCSSTVARLSEHLELEILASQHWARPLAPEEPVPGCDCSACTGVPPHRESRRQRALPPLPVEEARRADIVTVASRLGLGSPVDAGGGEVAVRCPFHDDTHPSLRLNRERSVFYCFPCGEGGDVIDLYMRARSVDFPIAVRELARMPA